MTAKTSATLNRAERLRLFQSSLQVLTDRLIEIDQGLYVWPLRFDWAIGATLIELSMHTDPVVRELTQYCWDSCTRGRTLLEGITFALGGIRPNEPQKVKDLRAAVFECHASRGGSARVAAVREVVPDPSVLPDYPRPAEHGSAIGFTLGQEQIMRKLDPHQTWEAPAWDHEIVIQSGSRLGVWGTDAIRAGLCRPVWPYRTRGWVRVLVEPQGYGTRLRDSMPNSVVAATHQLVQRGPKYVTVA